MKLLVRPSSASMVIRRLSKNFSLISSSSIRIQRRNFAAAAPATAEILPPPSAEGQDKTYSAKIVQIVDLISSLTLFEVADLNEALKKKLNIPDAPMMSFGTAMAAPAGASAAKEDDADAAPALEVKTSYTVRLLKYDETKKIDLIKELKNTIPGTNLVQAKKLVESLPQIIKKDVGKDEADKAKEVLAKFGGVCEID